MLLIKDAWAYDLLARTVLEHGVFGLGGIRPSAWFMPLYPMMIATVYRMLGQNPEVVIYFQYLLVILNLGLLFKIAEEFRSKMGRITILLAGIYLPFYYAAGMLLSETIFNTVFLYFIYRWTRRKSVGSATLFLDGVVVAIGVLIRPVIFFGAAGLMLMDIFRGKWLKVVVVSIGFGVMMLPWWIRNYVVFDRFVPFSLQGGEVVLGGTYYDYGFDPETWPTGKTEVEIDAVRKELAVSRLQIQARQELSKLIGWQVKKIWYLWSAPYYNQIGIFPPYKLVFIYHSLLLVLASIGGWRNRQNGSVRQLIILIGAISVIQVLTVGLDRYNLPLMYPVIVLASMSMFTDHSTARGVRKMMN